MRIFKIQFIVSDRVLNKLIWLMHMQARGTYCKPSSETQGQIVGGEGKSKRAEK